MKSLHRRFCALLTAALLAALSLMPAAASPAPALAQGGWRFFPESGCWVGNEFLEFFDRRGGVDIFGFPIDNAGIEDGLTVQYFQRARMELHPEAPAAYRVQLGLLGQALHGPADPPVTHDQLPTAGDRNHEYFSETGQVVSYAFLEYFRARGGVDIFGYPISAQATENGVAVQYFQRARLEWRPDNPARYRVQPGLVGVEVYLRRYGALPTPAPSSAGSATPTTGARAAPTTSSAGSPGPSAAGSPTSGALGPGAATPPTSPANGAAAAGDSLTVSHLIMFIVTFAVVVLAGLALLWRRGSLQDWLAHRGNPPAGQPRDGWPGGGS